MKIIKTLLFLTFTLSLSASKSNKTDDNLHLPIMTALNNHIQNEFKSSPSELNFNPNVDNYVDNAHARLKQRMENENYSVSDINEDVNEKLGQLKQHLRSKILRDNSSEQTVEMSESEFKISAMAIGTFTLALML